MEFTTSIYHVWPVEDIKEHDLTLWFPRRGKAYCSCDCGAILEWQENGAVIVRHNSFDGREGIDWANNILNLGE